MREREELVEIRELRDRMNRRHLVALRYRRGQRLRRRRSNFAIGRRRLRAGGMGPGLLGSTFGGAALGLGESGGARDDVQQPPHVRQRLGRLRVVL